MIDKLKFLQFHEKILSVRIKRKSQTTKVPKSGNESETLILLRNPYDQIECHKSVDCTYSKAPIFSNFMLLSMDGATEEAIQ